MRNWIMGCRLRMVYTIIGCILLIACSSFYLDLIKPQTQQGEMLNNIRPAHNAVTSDDMKEPTRFKPSPNALSLTKKLAQWIPFQLKSDLLVDEGNEVTLVRSMYTSGHIVSIPERCPNLGEKLRLLILVTSAPHHSEQRMAIRQTWGSIGQRTDVAMAFIVGITSKPEVRAAIAQEGETYGDMIQGNFVDSYQNLTLKTLSILEWCNKYCERVDFVMKIDDDTFVNIPKLMQLVEKHKGYHRSIFGRVKENSIPIRNMLDKWYVPESQFSGRVFPDYTLGGAYLMTHDIIRELYDLALDAAFLGMEDVFITGIVAQALNIKKYSISEFLVYYMPNPLDVCKGKEVIIFVEIKYNEQFQLWKMYFNGRSNCSQ